METLKAGTQYGDWEGTAEADDARNSLHKHLQDKRLIKENEFLIAVSFYSSEKFTDVRAFVYPGAEFNSVQKELASTPGPIQTREINVQLTTGEFLDLFKNFHVMLTWHGLPIEGREHTPSRSAS